MPENAIPQQNVIPSPSVPVSTQPTASQPLASSVPPQQLVNKNFWRFIIVFLILLPLITAIGIFGYQVYLSQTLSQTDQTKTPVIDPRLVVTPDLLPTASTSGELPSGWIKFSHSSAGYSFGYPPDWYVREGEKKEIILTNPASPTGAFIFEAIAANPAVTNSTGLANFIINQDKQSPLRITVATMSASTTISGLPLTVRYITKGSELSQVPEAHVGLDKNVIRVSAEGELANNLITFNQLVRTVTASSNQPVSNTDWTNYQNTFGYSLKYPKTVSLKSNDKTNDDASNIEKSTSIILFPIAELQNTTGFNNSLALQLTDREPPQSATLSATRDFGTKEFKAYETAGQIHYVGQLSSGNWLQIAFTHNSNIEQRSLMNQVLDTITVKEVEQLP